MGGWFWSMLGSIWHVICRAFDQSISRFSTSNLALSVVVVAFILPHIRVWMTQGFVAMKKKIIRDIGLGGALVVGVWLCLLGWSAVMTVYKDHVSFVQMARNLKSEAADCLNPPTLVRQIQWVSQQRASSRRDATYETDFVGESQKAIPHGLVVAFRCDHELVAGNADDGNEYLGATDVGVDQQDRERFVFWFHKRIPNLAPRSPLQVRLWSDYPLSCTPTTTLF